MASLRQLPAAILQSCARQIGERLHAEFTAAAGQSSDFAFLAGLKDFTAARFEMTESFEIWRLKTGAAADSVLMSEDLLTLARPAGAWHHQIKVGADAVEAPKTAVAYARSWPGEPEPDDWSVREVFFSPLAATIDRAIELADELLPEEAVTRLLSLPEYKIEALWFVALSDWNSPPDKVDTATSQEAAPSRITSQVLVVSAPASFYGAVMSPMSSTDFIRALARTRQGMGLLFNRDLKTGAAA